MYGLPEEVKFCKRCVMSNQRPTSAQEYKHTINTKKTTIHFNEEGVCDACLFAEKKKTGIDWAAREKELRELCDRFRRDDGQYDCLVPGSGGKDSFYASHVLKYQYGMHPLTVTWAPHTYTSWGWRNFQSWIHAGFDNYLHTPNGRVHRLLTRLATDTLFHPFQAFMLGQKFLAPKIAARFDIPLIFYGENEAEYGNPIVDASKAQRDWSYFTTDDPSSVFISGISVKELMERYKLHKNDLLTYMPSDPALLTDKKIQVHYLGYYHKWHPQGCYYYAVKHGGFEASPERTPGTYSKYNSIDDKIDDLFFYSGFIKFGIGRTSHDAAQEVRSGDITREEAVALVRRFDGEYPTRFEEDNFRYISIPESEFGAVSKEFKEPIVTRESFLTLADKFRPPHLWKKNPDGTWALKHVVS